MSNERIDSPSPSLPIGRIEQLNANPVPPKSPGLYIHDDKSASYQQICMWLRAAQEEGNRKDAQIGRLRVALEFYAAEQTYQYHYSERRVVKDRGRKAREVLADMQEEGVPPS